MGLTQSNTEAFSKAFDSLGNIVAMPGSAGIELITGGNPIEHIKSTTRDALTNVLFLPFRVAKHSAIGLLKATGKALWKGITHLPIFPLWFAERQEVQKGTRSQLDSLHAEIEPDTQHKAGEIGV